MGHFNAFRVVLPSYSNKIFKKKEGFRKRKGCLLSIFFVILTYRNGDGLLKLSCNGRGPGGEEAALKAVGRKACGFESCLFRHF
jgi:hypothetical protein